MAVGRNIELQRIVFPFHNSPGANLKQLGVNTSTE